MPLDVPQIRPVVRRTSRDALAYAIRLVLRKPWHCFFGGLAISYVFWVFLLMRSPATPALEEPRADTYAHEESDPSLLRTVPSALTASEPRPTGEDSNSERSTEHSGAVPMAPKPGEVRPIWVWPADEGAPTSGTGEQPGHGLAIRSPCGTPVLAAGSGDVLVAEWTTSLGNMVKIAHPEGLTTRYAHLARLEVLPGQRVSAGQQIGLAGTTGRTTGPGLHYEVRKGEQPINPLSLKYRYEPPWVFGKRDALVDCGEPTEPPDDWIARGTRIDGQSPGEARELLQEFGEYVRGY